MQLHHKIIHHVHKHKENIVAHVKKHHKKYIVGAGVLSGVAIYKVIGILIIFLGASQINSPIGADYYDAEYYATQTGEKINISNIIDTGEENTGTEINTATGCVETGTNGSGCTTEELKTTP